MAIDEGWPDNETGPERWPPDVELTVRRRAGALVVTLRGVVVGRDPAAFDAELRRTLAGEAVVVDVSQLTIVDPWAFAARLEELRRAADDVAIVCPRASSRRLLRRVSATLRGVALFASVGDALAAHRLAGEGYGVGWGPLGRRPPAGPGSVRALRAVRLPPAQPAARP
ncbi:MAG: hypothetical protein ACKVWR_13710 [Acidimicrobiales bacterium]